jgi:hypothetical protein
MTRDFAHAPTSGRALMLVAARLLPVPLRLLDDVAAELVVDIDADDGTVHRRRHPYSDHTARPLCASRHHDTWQ